MVARHCERTKCHRIVSFQMSSAMVNFMVCEFYVRNKESALDNGLDVEGNAEEPLCSFNKHQAQPQARAVIEPSTPQGTGGQCRPPGGHLGMEVTRVLTTRLLSTWKRSTAPSNSWNRGSQELKKDSFRANKYFVPN